MRRLAGWRTWFIIAWAGVAASASMIKVGDVIDIQVIQHPEFSGRYTVNEQGTIDYPLLTDHPVVNISTSELLQELTFQLARHIDNPLVTITIIDKPVISVTVLGQVIKPGTIATIEGASIQEAIIGAGGPVPDKADLSRIKIIHKGKSRMPDTFDMESFLKNGDIEQMPTLSANDVIIVLSRTKSSSIKVIGAVQKPGLFSLDEAMNLFEVIYLAGGPSERADLSKVRRFSKNVNGKVVEEIINVSDYIDNGKMESIPIVTEGDVIIVYNKWLDWKTMMTVLNNTLLFIVSIQTFAGFFK
jgi:protein involved in polysaccharide export with SLBB domain